MEVNIFTSRDKTLSVDIEKLFFRISVTNKTHKMRSIFLVWANSHIRYFKNIFANNWNVKQFFKAFFFLQIQLIIEKTICNNLITNYQFIGTSFFKEEICLDSFYHLIDEIAHIYLSQIPQTLPKLTIAFKLNPVMLNATRRWVVQNYFVINDIYDVHTAE